MRNFKIFLKNSYMFSLFPFSINDINFIPETVSSFEKFLFGIIILTLLTL
jgi:hypothetical protein